MYWNNFLLPVCISDGSWCILIAKKMPEFSWMLLSYVFMSSTYLYTFTCRCSLEVHRWVGRGSDFPPNLVGPIPPIPGAHSLSVPPFLSPHFPQNPARESVWVSGLGLSISRQRILRISCRKSRLVCIRLSFHLNRTCSGPPMGWTQQTWKVVGSGPTQGPRRNRRHWG